MARRKFTSEQIISKLREVEVALAQGATVSLAARGIGVTDQTYYRWRREYGGLTVEQAKRLKGFCQDSVLQSKLDRSEHIIGHCI